VGGPVRDPRSKDWPEKFVISNLAIEALDQPIDEVAINPHRFRQAEPLCAN
jgi:hypothetical protein